MSVKVSTEQQIEWSGERMLVRLTVSQNRPEFASIKVQSTSLDTGDISSEFTIPAEQIAAFKDAVAALYS